MKILVRDLPAQIDEHYIRKNGLDLPIKVHGMSFENAVQQLTDLRYAQQLLDALNKATSTGDKKSMSELLAKRRELLDGGFGSDLSIYDGLSRPVVSALLNDFHAADQLDRMYRDCDNCGTRMKFEQLQNINGKLLCPECKTRIVAPSFKASMSMMERLLNPHFGKPDSLEEKLDEADGEKDGKFSVHNLDSEDGNHDDQIDVSRLADAIQRGPGHISDYDEDGNKIED